MASITSYTPSSSETIFLVDEGIRAPSPPFMNRGKLVLGGFLFLSNLALLVAAIAYAYFSLELPFVALCITTYGVLYSVGTFFVRKGSISHAEYSSLYEKLKKTCHDLAYREESIKRMKETSNRLDNQQLKIDEQRTELEELRKQKSDLRKQITRLKVLSEQEEHKRAQIRDLLIALENSVEGQERSRARGVRLLLGI